MNRSFRCSLRHWSAHTFAHVSLAMLCTSGAFALPVGRVWTSMDTTKVPGHTRLYPDRFDMDPHGRPTVFATGAGGIGYDEFVLRWTGDDWSVVQQLGYHTAFLHPAIPLDESVPLIWQTLDRIYEPGLPYVGTYLVSAEFVNDQYANLDTIAIVNAVNFVYSSATSPRRKWAVKSDGAYGLRTWYSDTARVWHHLFLPGRGGFGVAVAAIDDTSALITWIDIAAPIWWGILRGSSWEPGGILPGDVFALAKFPSFRRSPSGALWLAWTTDREFVQFATFRDGAWTSPDSVSAPKPVAGRWVSGDVRQSRDRWELPVIAWVEHNAQQGYVGTICLSVPTKDGHPSGENLPGTDDAIFAEAVRDSLGDVWLVWRSSDNGMFWTHTYVRSTVAKLAVSHQGPKRTLDWVLDEPAPDSWWTVLRARKSEPFEEAGRIQAGEGLEMSWTDDESLPEHSRYKVRRDCLDTRYRVESEEVSWPPGLARRPADRGGPRLKQPASPLGQEGEFDLAGRASGPLEIALYDLQGRLVYSRMVEAGETGRLRFPLGATGTPLTSGIYFARVRDGSGVWSPAVRAVVLK